MKIAVAGIGYVGVSNAVLLAQHCDVVMLDLDLLKVDAINRKHAPIADAELVDFLGNKALRLRATQEPENAYSNADFVLIATPTPAIASIPTRSSPSSVMCWHSTSRPPW